MAKPRGLGRGLDALLAGNEEPAAAADRLQTLPLSALQPGKYQPRTKMDDEPIAELAESLKTQGMIQPILARPVGPDRYEIIAGERRWRAAQKAGLTEVPVLIRDVKDEAALAMALIENIQREDLTAIEEAAGLQRLIDDFGMTHQSAADAVGRSRSAVSNLLRLLTLPSAVQAMLADGRLDMGHARALLPLPTGKQLELAHRLAAEGMSVRDAEKAAAHALTSPNKSAQSRKRPDADVRRLEEELSDALGTKVELGMKNKRAGKLSIHFSTLDQLDVVLAKLRA